VTIKQLQEFLSFSFFVKFKSYYLVYLCFYSANNLFCYLSYESASNFFSPLCLTYLLGMFVQTKVAKNGCICVGWWGEIFGEAGADGDPYCFSE
jgi:hypothetical protein